MAAPQGSFSSYGGKAVAVEVIDRSIEEQTPGVYETIAKLRSPGLYDVVFFTDAPRLSHCFSAEVKSDENYKKQRLVNTYGNVGVDFVDAPKVMLTNMDFNVNIKLTDIKSGERLTGLPDVEIMGMMASTNWHKKMNANEVNDSGSYSVNMNFNKAGIYYLYVQSISQKFTFDNPQYHIIQVFNNPNQDKK
ncbi:MAG: hypothetical protein JKY48_08555 [Flavobacteriales bacterium]|nr:hypothetical protein [Flavobacteriales bacterium]